MAKIKGFLSKHRDKLISAIIGLIFGGLSMTGIIAGAWKQVTLPWQNAKEIQKLYILVDEKVDKSTFEVYKMDENGKWRSINDKVEIILKYTSHE